MARISPVPSFMHTSIDPSIPHSYIHPFLHSCIIYPCIHELSGAHQHMCLQVVMKSPRGPLKQLLYNDTVELEPEVVIAILKDVASALKYLHQQKPPCLDKELTTAGVMLNNDLSAQMLHIHISTVGCSFCHLLPPSANPALHMLLLFCLERDHNSTRDDAKKSLLLSSALMTLATPQVMCVVIVPEPFWVLCKLDVADSSMIT